MLDWLWLIPALPLAGFLVLVIGRPLPRAAVAAIGVGSILLSAIVAVCVAASFISAPPLSGFFVQRLWSWMSVAGFTPQIALYLDQLSVVMMLVVTVVGFLIHLYSARFMAEEEGYGRFFAYMNLFVGSMLLLVLGDNLLLLYLGWEGVGLCSYLLIGFWYKDSANGRAAIKAFIVTRVGDAAMAVGLFLLFTQLGTLNIQELMRRSSEQWPVGSPLAVAAALLLLGGAVGKSAQLPLQTWLPDAMAGPSPVSALIHAATMVTAGVYLIARTHVLFTLAPNVQLLVAIIGAATLLLAGFSAFTQRDIKRVLAYSTISQIGYMFLALGVGAWSAAIFHFMTHAFFKALLFLAAGVVIIALHEEHDMFKMGGLWKRMPVTFWTFLVGALSLAAIPPITAGFFSKGFILSSVYHSPVGGRILWLAGMLGVVLTAGYSTRMVLLTFFGPPKSEPTRRAGWVMGIPLVVLAGASLAVGVFELPSIGHADRFFVPFIEKALPAVHETAALPSSEMSLEWESMLASLAGIVLGFAVVRQRGFVAYLVNAPIGAALRRFWLAGWGFDWLYDRLFVRPAVFLARINKADFIDGIYSAIAWITEQFNRLLSLTVSGQVRWYAMALAIGAVLIVALAVWL